MMILAKGVTPEQIIADKKMRRALFEWLWQFHPDAQAKTPRPCPYLSDDRIKSELKRIIVN